jgi:predicted HAD superfamily phosphohydrolase YqeG
MNDKEQYFFDHDDPNVKELTPEEQIESTKKVFKALSEMNDLWYAINSKNPQDLIDYEKEHGDLVDKKYLLIDLDGTLVDTADPALKPMKDGQAETDLSQIRVFEGATNFIAEAINLGFKCVVLSDSHPRYVNPIVKQLFGDIAALSLADKPNTSKTLKFFQEQSINHSDSVCYVIGDSWLDIELGRGLEVPTILTGFYDAKTLEIRDGIGDYVKNIKSGSTYYAKSYTEVLEILKNPLDNLLCLEAGFSGINSHIARNPRFPSDTTENRKLTAHRILARQASGECDQYHATGNYFEFNRVDRSQQLLHTIRNAVLVYIEWVLSYQSYSWDIFTYVPDKGTTQPENKMGELFNLIAEQIEERKHHLSCLNIFEWSEEVSTSTRKQPTKAERCLFVSSNLNLRPEINVKNKNVIILDDQYTTGATADALTEKLWEQGAQNVLFIALFHLVTNVSSNRLCPVCSKPIQLRINRTTGKKFYSCVPPKFKGDGCGYIDSGKLCPVCLENGMSKYMSERKNTQTGNQFYSCVPPQYKGDGCGYTENIL